MRLSLRSFFWLLPLLAAAAAPCSAWAKTETAGKAPIAASKKDAPLPVVRLPAPPRPAIWLLADEDTKIYLFGTVHILPPGFRWRSPAIDRIIAQADELVVETYEQPGKEEHADARLSFLLPAPVPILSRVPEGKRAALKTAIRQTQVPIAFFDRMQTWAAGMTLGMAQLLGSYGAGDPAE